MLDKTEKKQLSKKKYDYTCIRLSEEERVLLKKMMDEEEWLNAAGFFKYKTFGLDVENKYKQILRTSDPKDIEIVMETLLDSVANNLSFLCKKFEKGMELMEKKLGKSDNTDGKRILSKFILLDKEFNATVRLLLYTSERLLRNININVKNHDVADLKYCSDEELEAMCNTWDTADSPARHELLRRMYERNKDK